MFWSRSGRTSIRAFRLSALQSASTVLTHHHAQCTARNMRQICLQQSYTNSTSVRQTKYKTIKVTNEDDIERLYPLLLSYIAEPAKANSLREVIIDTYAWPSFYSCFYDEDGPILLRKGGEVLERKRANRQVDHDTHSSLEEHVLDLGLGDYLTDQLIEALVWKKRHWMGHVSDNARDFDDHERKFAAAAVVILLSLCNSLSTIHIADFPTLVGEYLLRNNYDQVKIPGLQQLKTVEFIKTIPLDDRNYENVDFLEYFRYFGRLPAMESLMMEGVTEYEIEGLVSPGTSNIKNIHLSHVDISGSTLGMVIRAPKALEEFKIVIGGLWQMEPGRFNIRPQTLGKSLLQHKHTLRVLELDISDFDYSEVNSWEDDALKELEQRGKKYYQLDKASSSLTFWLKDVPDDRAYGSTIGSLYDFTALTHLSISLSALLGPSSEIQKPPFRLLDALPPNLKYLCLFGYVKGKNKEVDDHIEELVQHKRDRFPSLVEIQGVDETVMGVSDTYAGDDQKDERDLWKWPERNWEWIET
ncbi:hypothetical protein NW762_008500 [Fusarium torreyae]|uniref:Uncharacterized protein n=1 Tax=Fusarium torreyae TaxID=1237075 RepID=A0A9W8VBY7_9HYPO|nr:hypothetical protein NW762_008500 [Fusarium torreyae]